MERPDAKLEADLGKAGIFLVEKGGPPHGDPALPPAYIGIRIEILWDASVEFTPPDYGVRTVSNRGVKVDFCDWRIEMRGTEAILVIDALMKIPEGEQPMLKSQLTCCSFTDLCWSTGTDPVTVESNGSPVPIMDGARYGGLSWYLPANVLDNMIDAIGKLNDTLLNGAAQDALIYGPLTR